MNEKIDVARSKGETAPELECVPAHPMLPSPRGFDPLPRGVIVAAEKMEESSASEFSGAESFAILIDKKGKENA